MPVSEGFVTILVTEETRRWLRLLSAVQDRPIYSIVSGLVAHAVDASPVRLLATHGESSGQDHGN
jgi:hypothetical protein